jgi:hypothetical protein
MNQEDTEISDDTWLDGKTHSLEVGNRPSAYILDVEEEGMKMFSTPNTICSTWQDNVIAFVSSSQPFYMTTHQ